MDVHSDPLLLRRVLQNFLANAIRYTRHGGVLLGVRRHGQCLSIGVHDTGPGIAAEQQAVVFEEFHRVDRSNGQGLGLGLTIASRIADLLHAPVNCNCRARLIAARPSPSPWCGQRRLCGPAH